MAIRQLLGMTDQVGDNSGNPLAGGEIHIFEPNTTNRLTSYSDSSLETANPNPVILSGGGRATIWISADADIRIESREGVVIAEQKSVNPESSVEVDNDDLVQNGSFELDTDGDGTPDFWTESLTEPGSNNGIDSTQSSDGSNSYRTESTGSGGGRLITTDFFAVNEVDDLHVHFDLKTDTPAVHNQVIVFWFDLAQSGLGSTSVYNNSSNNPTVFTTQTTTASPPAGSRFAKLQIEGGGALGQQTGKTYWDRVRVFYPTALSGVFDNLLLDDNTISSTNSNGNIIMDPDGTGKVQIASDLEVQGTSGIDLTDSTVALSVGAAAGQHLELDPDAIQSKASATTVNQLTLQPSGGNIFLGISTSTVHVDGTNAVDLSDNLPAFLVGDNNGQHLEMDGETVQSKSNSTTAAALKLNDLGGDVDIGGSGSTVTIAGQLLVTNTTAIDLTDTAVAFLIGTASGQHLEFDADQIQSKSNGTTAAALLLNSLGGDVTVGAANSDITLGGASSNITVGGASAALTFSGSSTEFQSNVTLGDSDATITIGGTSSNITMQGTSILCTGPFTLSNNLRASGSNTVDLTDIAVAFLVGSGSGQHLEFDGDQIQSKSNATTASTLDINSLGGDVDIGAQSGTGGVNLYHNTQTKVVTQDESAADKVTGAQVRHHDDALHDVGLATMPRVTFTANLTLDQVHCHKILDHTDSSGHNLTLNNDGDIPVDAVVWVQNSGSGVLTLVAGTGVTLRWMDGDTGGTGNRSLAQYGWATIHKVSDTEYRVTGAGLS